MENELSILHLTWDHPDARRLRDAQQAEIDELRPRGLGVPATAANVSTFLVAYRAGVPIACGGLRPLANEGGSSQAEIKRMYVAPSERGGPAAKQILQALEETARELKVERLKVETSKAMAQARRFYEKTGYVGCEVFGYYQDSELIVFYEKVL